MPSEQQPAQPNEYHQELELQAFRDELQKLAQEEVREGKTAHFKDVDFKPEELTKEDMEIWKKVQDGTITSEDFIQYRRGYGSRARTETQAGFESMASNRATVVIGRRQMEERFKQQNQS